METTDYMDDIVNRAIEEQNHKYREAASDLNIWHCPSLTSQNFGSKDCKWNIHKGIYIGGKVGCGKTLLMQSFCEILHLISRRTVEMIPATLLYERIIHDGIDMLAKRPLFIDELGREQLEIAAFGNKIRPIADLMALRYNNGARTFFTSNFKLSTLSRGRNEKGELIGYGQYIGERIQEMTNIVEMPGESRREKWEEEKAL